MIMCLVEVGKSVISDMNQLAIQNLENKLLLFQRKFEASLYQQSFIALSNFIIKSYLNKRIVYGWKIYTSLAYKTCGMSTSMRITNRISEIRYPVISFPQS